MFAVEFSRLRTHWFLIAGKDALSAKTSSRKSVLEEEKPPSSDLIQLGGSLRSLLLSASTFRDKSIWMKYLCTLVGTRNASSAERIMLARNGLNYGSYGFCPIQLFPREEAAFDPANRGAFSRNPGRARNCRTNSARRFFFEWQWSERLPSRAQQSRCDGNFDPPRLDGS